MSGLEDALVAKNEMRMRYDEAKHELVEATIEAIEQSGEGMTAREIAGGRLMFPPVRLWALCRASQDEDL